MSLWIGTMRSLVIAIPMAALLLFLLISFGFAVVTYGKSGNNNKLFSADFDSLLKRIKVTDDQEWISNPSIVFLNNQSGKVIYGLPSYWNDSSGNCKTDFKCLTNSTTGWKNDTRSFQVSTTSTKNDTWSWIYGKEIDVNSGEKYALVTHMKLNRYATGSHIATEGYNETSKRWYQFVTQCPSGTNGPLRWRGFSCAITIPANTSKIRPVLNAGWSSQPGKEAVTLFGPLYLTNWGFAPIINDANLKIELVYKGLENPVTIAFLGPNDFLVGEHGGKVKRVTNGVESKQPLLDVASNGYGLLGIATAKHRNGPTYVFLYTVPTGGKRTNSTLFPICNCLYRYELVNNKLVSPKLLLNFSPKREMEWHKGGIIKIGPDNNLYISGGNFLENKTLTENFHNSTSTFGGVIYRISQNGESVGNILGSTDPLNKFYAYGIRNSFGIDFDPITKKLWDTENGPDYGDEINLVDPGFNSGWAQVQGIWKPNGDSQGPIAQHPESNLVNFGGKGKYRPPEFTWRHTVGPTALVFLNSTALGKQYQNDMFVGDYNNGNIYHFKLNKNRTGLLLNDSLAGKIADQSNDAEESILATGFGGITDIKVGPDGYLYAISFDNGKIYRIVEVSTR
jgi:aldose sugar dehydrogenase